VAGNEEQALDVARDTPGIQVMLAAFRRRGINGPALVQKFATEFPDVRPLLLSGLSETLDEDSTTAYVSSPFDSAALLSAVARALH